MLYSVQQNAAWADEQKEKTTEEISTNEEVVDEKKVVHETYIQDIRNLYNQ